VAYNAATGAQRWLSRYNGRANSNDFANTVVVAPGGHAVYVTGGSRGKTSRIDFATVAYNAATGALRWVSRYNGPGNFDDFGRSLAVTPNGHTMVVTGPSWGVASNTDYATIAYNTATGAQLWVSRYNGPGNSSDGARALVVSPSGDKVYVTGFSDATVGTNTSGDYATIAYKA